MQSGLSMRVVKRPVSVSHPSKAVQLEQKNEIKPKTRKTKDQDTEVEGINCSMNIDDQMRIEEHAERLATSARKKGNQKYSSKKDYRLDAINKSYIQNNHKIQVLKSNTMLQRPKTSYHYERIDSAVDNFLDIIHLETKVSFKIPKSKSAHPKYNFLGILHVSI